MPAYKDQYLICYFHICQKSGWERSFDCLMYSIKQNNLYDALHEIRVGIVNDVDNIIPDERLNDPKIVIVLHKNAIEYERPTLSHMREYSDTDNPNTVYLYLHTKGISHYGNPCEPFVKDWIDLLSYWNITKWKLALVCLKKYNTYGCNIFNNNGIMHYSGNFWWANKSHIQTLPRTIGNNYVDPEDWIGINNKNMCNIYSSGLAGGGNYFHPCPRINYIIPGNFQMAVYKKANKHLENLDFEQIISHYLQNRITYTGGI